MKAIALDVYGTLIDLNGILTTLEKMIVGDAKVGDQLFRLVTLHIQKAIEYNAIGPGKKR